MAKPMATVEIGEMIIKANEQQIKMFLVKHPNYVLLEEETLFPMENDADGFYYAKLKRNQ